MKAKTESKTANRVRTTLLLKALEMFKPFLRGCSTGAIMWQNLWKLGWTKSTFLLSSKFHSGDFLEQSLPTAACHQLNYSLFPLWGKRSSDLYHSLHFSSAHFPPSSNPSWLTLCSAPPSSISISFLWSRAIGELKGERVRRPPLP